MSGLKTCLASLLLVAAAPGALRALAPAPAQQADVFAACAGRLSATMEHQWMFDGAGSERTEAQRAAMIALLEAVQPPQAGRRLLHLRIEAKLAQAALLTRARFSADAAEARHALRLAEVRLAECTGMLLG